MFSEKLKKLRKEKRVTQIELAKILSVDCSTVTKWETGKSNPDLNKIQKIADFFDVSIDYLLGRDENKEIYVIESGNEAGNRTVLNVSEDEMELVGSILKIVRKHNEKE